jgi:hypothetical protein
MPFEALSAASACELLAKAGFQVAPPDVHIEAREERWLVRLPKQRLAWFAASTTGLRRLQNERRVLRLLEARCSFRVPRVLFESATGELDVRAMVPGGADPWSVYAHVLANVKLAADIGTAVGTMLAEQHTRIGAADVAGWLPRRPAWPEPSDWIRERLAQVVNDSELIASATAIVDAYDRVPVLEADRALVHTDVGFHNLGIDLETHTVHGIFDYDGAAWADRHHDFRYLMFDVDRNALLEAALSAYEAIADYHLQHARIRLYNAACAVSYLAHRAGTAPEARPCGRTLEEDLRWTKFAIANVSGW